MITPRRPSGFNEFLPAEQMAFNAMMSVIRLVYEQHGYSPIETPAIELTSVLLAKEGGETAKQLYRFTKGDNDLALRFDLTVPLARYASEHYHKLAFPFRRYQIQEVWRAEKAQAGRFRQFYQCDIDILGSVNIMADADVLITAYETLKTLGLKDAVLYISHRGLITGWLESKKLTRFSTAVLRAIDKISKHSTAEISTELTKAGLNKNNIKDILAFANISGSAKEVLKKLSNLNIKQTIWEKGLKDLTELANLLKAAGLKDKDFIFDLKIARGFDYYTGMVFETILKNNPQSGSICSGGRYDNLTDCYRKDPLVGVGASIGLSRLFSVLKNKLDISSATPANALIIPLAKEVIPYCLIIAKKIKQANLNVFIYPGVEKMSKQLAYANKLKIPKVIIIGEDELKKKVVTIKNMTTGKQLVTGFNKIISTLKK